jgi:GT2 family glycosyltransferase
MSEPDALLASVVISTFNRCDALPATLEALVNQSVPPDRYEVIVVDDGSTDDTGSVLAAMQMPYVLRLLRHDVNRGVSAGRNLGMRAARGALIIMLSDDLVVSENFIAAHVETHERYPDAWVVGGFAQLAALTTTPFGRYLDALESSFEAYRGPRPIAPHVFELAVPTARNLSLPRSDLERVGYFDEQFRVACEDQDLQERATAAGIRFLYNDEIGCVHNDYQAADVLRYCRQQERGAVDTVRLVRKHPELHGGTALIAANGPIRRADGPILAAKKLLKAVLATPPLRSIVHRLVVVGERRGLPEPVLFRLYTLAIALATFRGWRAGLAQEGPVPPR